MNDMEQIPIFPLGLVLFPKMPLPLHIFEERYKTMIRECIEGNRPFGIVFFNGKRIHDKGCTARIGKILEEYPDGRSDILVKGERRFVIEQLIEDKPYLQAKVRYFDDDLEKITVEWEELSARGINMMWQLGNIPLAGEEEKMLERLDYQGVSFLVASCDGFTWEEKQALLEMTSTLERLRKGTRSLEIVLERNRVTRKIKSIIGGNGDVKKYFKSI